MTSKLSDIINQIRINKGLNPIKEMSKNLNLRDDLDLNSLDLAELTAKIDFEFGVDVFANGMISTVAEIEQQIH